MVELDPNGLVLSQSDHPVTERDAGDHGMTKGARHHADLIEFDHPVTEDPASG